MQALLKTWVGQIVLLVAVCCFGFGWVWWVIHGEINATLMQGLVVAVLSAGGVHFIHSQKSSTNGAGGIGGAGGAGGAGGQGGAGGAAGVNGANA